MPRLSVRKGLRIVPGFLFALVAWSSPLLAADPPANNAADRDWQTILEQAAGPGKNFRTQTDAMMAVRQHLDRQETALRSFVNNYPADAHRFSARIRLASVLAVQGRLLNKPPSRAEAQKILTDLEGNPATPAPVKADAGFARVSQLMEDSAGRTDEATRETLLRAIREFETAYPGDRRDPNLLAEVATLYDAQPARKKSLLEEALAQSKDESVRKRIYDDLKRIDMLGRPVNARLQPWQGGASINLTDRKGRAAVILFWASWSGPSLQELARLEEVSKQFSSQPIDFLTVSLDNDRAALAEAVKASGIPWLVHCDGKSWEGELVRSLGINALPTVWVLDRKGNLTTLNARGQEAEAIRHALE